ncbi:MAG: AAA family ATPase, partial [Spirochaetes bacterium]|nr:AAA family ATPase [Spirochaetota bacterium]
YINKEDLSFDEVRTARDLVDYVRARRIAAETYVLIDEVQYIEDWERGVASLNGQGDVRVVISGSNSSMLAGDLATRLSGRFVTLRMLPLSLSEFGELYAATQGEEIPPDRILEQYRSVGGLPGLLHTDLSGDITVQMQRDIFSTIAMRDIIRRHRIRDVNTFEAITSFAMDNVGNLVSAKRISDFLKSTRRTGSPAGLNGVRHLSLLDFLMGESLQ